jgi:hypothetical protein
MATIRHPTMAAGRPMMVAAEAVVVGVGARLMAGAVVPGRCRRGVATEAANITVMAVETTKQRRRQRRRQRRGLRSGILVVQIESCVTNRGRRLKVDDVVRGFVVSSGLMRTAALIPLALITGVITGAGVPS